MNGQGAYPLGFNNPFRYRGYYFDYETNLYYLHSRYYDPVNGRFISQDDVSYLDRESINGLNLYAYCLNNPIMYTDSTGCAPKWWQAILIGVGIIAVTALAIVQDDMLLMDNFKKVGDIVMVVVNELTKGAENADGCK